VPQILKNLPRLHIGEHRIVFDPLPRYATEPAFIFVTQTEIMLLIDENAYLIRTWQKTSIYYFNANCTIYITQSRQIF